MAKILFDGTSMQSSSRAAFHGGGEYAKYMLRAFLQQGYIFDVVFSKRLHTDLEIEKLLSEEHKINIYYVSEKHEIYSLIENNKYDVFYSVLPVSYSDYNCRAKLIGVVHGLRAVELPWDFYRYKYESDWKRRSISWIISHFNVIQKHLKEKHIEESRRLLKIKNSLFVTASNHTKYSMLSFYPELKPENIRVFYSPFTVSSINHKTPKENYFLMVSANRYEKNVYRAVRVFDRLFSEGLLDGKKVVITGCGKQPFWKKIKNADHFIMLPYISTDELESLYERAFCFVYPSLNEGFGYPPLKAMAYGTPVIASSATSIPEVCNEAACFFSPTNEDDLAARILRVVYDTEFREELANKGCLRVKELLEKQEKAIVKEIKMIFE